MYSVHPRQLIGLDEPLDLFNPPTVLVLEYDMDGVDPLLVFQVSITVYYFTLQKQKITQCGLLFITMITAF